MQKSIYQLIRTKHELYEIITIVLKILAFVGFEIKFAVFMSAMENKLKVTFQNLGVDSEGIQISSSNWRIKGFNRNYSIIRLRNNDNSLSILRNKSMYRISHMRKREYQ